MINIRTEYAEEIKRIIAAAEANKKEALENTEKCEQVLDEHEDHLKDLVQASASSLSQFSNACKQLKKFGRTVEPDPAVVISTAEVFLEYGKIAEQLPEAREHVKKAKGALVAARAEEKEAFTMLDKLDYLQETKLL